MIIKFPHLAFGALVLLASAALSGCSGDGCIDNRSSLPVAAFFKGTTAVSITNLSVRGIGAPGDSIFIDKQSVSEIYLPLRPSTDICQFELNYNVENAPADTITVRYSSQPAFASVDCGAMLNFEISDYSYTRHAIDSVALVKPMVTNDNAKTFRIYMR